MICTSFQILSIEIAKTNTKRHRIPERKKMKEGLKYLVKNGKDKNDNTRKPRNFPRRIEGTKRSSKKESTKTSLIPKTNLWFDSGNLFSNSRVTYTITFDCFYVICEPRWVVKKEKGSKQWSAIQKQCYLSKAFTSNEKAKSNWSIKHCFNTSKICF